MLKTRILFSSITIAALAGSVLIAANSEKQFHPGPADSYAHQKSEDVVIGARIYNTPELVEEAFGKKMDFARYDVTPVLVVVENNRKHSIDLRSMEVSIVGADGNHTRSMRADEVHYLAQNGKSGKQVPLNFPVPLPKRKAGIAGPEVESRAFVAEMLAPGDSANGFFYFNGRSEPGDKLYVNGVQEAPSGREITYFEFPFEP